MNASFHLSSFLMQTLLYPYLKSIFVNIEAWLSNLIRSTIQEIK